VGFFTKSGDARELDATSDGEACEARIHANQQAIIRQQAIGVAHRYAAISEKGLNRVAISI
jgi:hypothetical protein